MDVAQKDDVLQSYDAPERVAPTVTATRHVETRPYEVEHALTAMRNAHMSDENTFHAIRQAIISLPADRREQALIDLYQIAYEQRHNGTN